MGEKNIAIKLAFSFSVAAKKATGRPQYHVLNPQFLKKANTFCLLRVAFRKLMRA